MRVNKHTGFVSHYAGWVGWSVLVQATVALTRHHTTPHHITHDSAAFNHRTRYFHFATFPILFATTILFGE